MSTCMQSILHMVMGNLRLTHETILNFHDMSHLKIVAV